MGITNVLNITSKPGSIYNSSELSEVQASVKTALSAPAFEWAGEYANGVTLDTETRLLSVKSGSDGFIGGVGVIGTHDPLVQDLKTIGKVMKYKSAQTATTQNLNLMTATADDRFDVMSLTKAITGCVFLKMSKDFENTDWEFVLNRPLQEVIPSLANTKYMLIQKTGGTEALTLPTDVSSGVDVTENAGIIVKTNKELFLGTKSIASETLMSKAMALTLVTVSGGSTLATAVDFTTEVGYKLVPQIITIGDCLAECAGQDLLHIAPWKFTVSIAAQVSKNGTLFNYDEMVGILNAADKYYPLHQNQTCSWMALNFSQTNTG